MIQKYVIPVVAFLGIALAVFTVFRGNRQVRPAPPVALPPQAIFPNTVAGAGIIEASSQNIGIGTNVPGIVEAVYVRWGDEVKKGAPLFKIDDRQQRSDLDVRRAAIDVAEASLENAKTQLDLAERLSDKRAISTDDYNKRKYGHKEALARLDQARADYQSAKTMLQRMTVRAPISGQILQINVHTGEYAPAGESVLLLMGNVHPLHVRVDIDENEAWKVRPGMPARGYLRGNRDINTPLKFVRFDPYVIPKRSLTGDSTERVDTRVLQVIYSFERGSLPIFVGQQMDVFIETPDSLKKKPESAGSESPPTNAKTPPERERP